MSTGKPFSEIMASLPEVPEEEHSIGSNFYHPVPIAKPRVVYAHKPQQTHFTPVFTHDNNVNEDYYREVQREQDKAKIKWFMRFSGRSTREIGIRSIFGSSEGRV